MKLSTLLREGHSVELRCGQCFVNNERSTRNLRPALVGTLHASGAGQLVFTELQRVAASGHDQRLYPVSYQPLVDNPTPEDQLLLGAHRGNEAALVAAGIAGTTYYDYTSNRPVRKVQRATHNGFSTRCRLGHDIGLSAAELAAMLDQPLPFIGGTFIPGRV